MKKIIVIFVVFLILAIAFHFVFTNYYFSDEKLREKQIATWNKRINEFENTKSGTIDLKNEAELRWTIIDFNSSNHQIEYCKNEYQDATYICSIDNKLWYGSDFRMDLPKYELKSLIFFVEKKLIKLDVSQMFNPNLNGELIADQFKLEKKDNYYILYGYFSDGAGTYTTNWKIKNGKSERGKLSNDEEDFNWQNAK